MYSKKKEKKIYNMYRGMGLFIYFINDLIYATLLFFKFLLSFVERSRDNLKSMIQKLKNRKFMTIALSVLQTVLE